MEYNRLLLLGQDTENTYLMQGSAVQICDLAQMQGLSDWVQRHVNKVTLLLVPELACVQCCLMLYRRLCY